MRRNVLVSGSAVFALVLGGCGGDDDGRARTVDLPAPETPDEEPDEAEDEPQPDPGDFDVAAALLTLSDMPTGWTQDPEQDADDEDATLCDVEPLEEVQAVDDASADFSAGDFGPLLSHMVGVYEDQDAEAAMDSFMDALEGCTEWTDETEDGPVTFRPTPLAFPSFGDDTVAVRIRAESELFDMTLDVVVWRRANVVSLITVIEVFGTPDADQTEEFVTVADERLAALK
jgi:hypothetical protein